MPTPPTPFLPAVLLLAAAKLGWRFVTRGPAGDLGQLVDDIGAPMSLLLMQGTAPGSDAWVLLDNVPRGFPPSHHLVSQATYDILHGGAAAPDGTVLYKGQSYRARVWYDGVNLTAEAIPA
jgi:hypothetical protein